MAPDGSIQADAAKRALDDMGAALMKQIRALVLRLDTQRGDSKLLSDKEALDNALRIQAQVQRAMEDRGYRPVVAEADKQVLSLAKAYAKDANLGDFSPEMAADIERAVNGQMKDVADTFAKGSDEIAAVIRRNITTGAPIADLLDQVAQALDTTILRAQTAVDAAIMGAGRRLAVEDAEQAQEAAGEPMVMIYVGPSSGNVRKFCKRYVGKAVLLDDLDRLDNETDLDAATFGGGYNCRHSWAPALLSDAKERGIEVVKP